MSAEKRVKELADLIEEMVDEFGWLTTCSCHWPRTTDFGAVQRRMVWFAREREVDISADLESVNLEGECFTFSVVLISAWMSVHGKDWPEGRVTLLVYLLSDEPPEIGVRYGSVELRRLLAEEIRQRGRYRVKLL